MNINKCSKHLQLVAKVAGEWLVQGGKDNKFLWLDSNLFLFYLPRAVEKVLNGFAWPELTLLEKYALKKFHRLFYLNEIGRQLNAEMQSALFFRRPGDKSGFPFVLGLD